MLLMTHRRGSRMTRHQLWPHKDSQAKNFQRGQRDRLCAAMIAARAAGRLLPPVGNGLRHTAIHNRKGIQQQIHTRQRPLKPAVVVSVPCVCCRAACHYCALYTATPQPPQRGSATGPEQNYLSRNVQSVIACMTAAACFTSASSCTSPLSAKAGVKALENSSGLFRTCRFRYTQT